MKTIAAIFLVLGSSCAVAQVGHYSLGHRDEAKAIALGFNISPNIHITSKKITYTVQF